MIKQSTSYKLSIIALLAFAVFSFRFFLGTASADLMATWLAGVFLQSGELGQVYPANTEMFDMYPPDQWRPYMAELGYTGPVFPFIYPPLWAKLGTLIPGFLGFRVLTVVATLVNPLLIGGMILLARRASGSKVDPLLYVSLALAAMLITHVGSIALMQNQPQILVSFLIVLAIERSRNGAPLTAGAVLALAAAIKLYPVLFALFWVATGQRRAFYSFAFVGGTLGLLSVALTGWQLHADFLSQVSVISRTALVSGISFGIDPAIAQLFFADQFSYIPALETLTGSIESKGWYGLRKPEIWVLLSRLALLATVAGLFLLFRRASEKVRYGAIWPLALTLVSLLGPLTWAYHYLPAFAFLPALLGRLGHRGGAVVVFFILAPIFSPLVSVYRGVEFVPYLYQLVGTFSMALMAGAFALSAWRRTG